MSLSTLPKFAAGMFRFAYYFFKNRNRAVYCNLKLVPGVCDPVSAGFRARRGFCACWASCLGGSLEGPPAAPTFLPPETTVFLPSSKFKAGGSVERAGVRRPADSVTGLAQLQVTPTLRALSLGVSVQSRRCLRSGWALVFTSPPSASPLTPWPVILRWGPACSQMLRRLAGLPH